MISLESNWTPTIFAFTSLRGCGRCTYLGSQHRTWNQLGHHGLDTWQPVGVLWRCFLIKLLCHTSKLFKLLFFFNGRGKKLVLHAACDAACRGIGPWFWSFWCSTLGWPSGPLLWRTTSHGASAWWYHMLKRSMWELGFANVFTWKILQTLVAMFLGSVCHFGSKYLLWAAVRLTLFQKLMVFWNLWEALGFGVISGPMHAKVNPPFQDPNF